MKKNTWKNLKLFQINPLTLDLQDKEMKIKFNQQWLILQIKILGVKH